MAPHVLIDPDHRDGVEPGRVVDQDPVPLGQDRGVGGVPGDRQGFSDPRDGQVRHHQGLQRPGQRPPGQLRPRLGRGAGVLAPHMPTPGAPVAAHRDLQDRGTPPERLVGQAPGDRVPGCARAPASSAPPVRRDHPAGQDRAIRLEPLPDDFKAELVQASERGQVRASEGSVRHVEVFQMGGVRTSIIGRPRPLPAPRRAAPDQHTATPSIAKSHECPLDLGRWGFLRTPTYQTKGHPVDASLPQPLSGFR